MQYILGSKSPRRHQILQAAGYNFEVMVAEEDEVIDASWKVEDVPQQLAEQKARFIQPRIEIESYTLITADTVVIVDDEIIGKPIDLEQAKMFLKKLSGRAHKVISGVCIANRTKKIAFSDETKVGFKELTNYEIDYYLKNYEVLDKAGAYAIQEWIGIIGVEYLHGSYYNVMGLPIHKLYKELEVF